MCQPCKNDYIKWKFRLQTVMPLSKRWKVTTSYPTFESCLPYFGKYLVTLSPFPPLNIHGKKKEEGRHQVCSSRYRSSPVWTSLSSSMLKSAPSKKKTVKHLIYCSQVREGGKWGERCKTSPSAVCFRTESENKLIKVLLGPTFVSLIPKHVLFSYLPFPSPSF